MSMCRGCKVVERYPGQWFCAVAMEEYDFDFKRYVVYGPKPTERAAYEAMTICESNPGQFDVVHHADVDEKLAKFIDEGRQRNYIPRIPHHIFW